MFPQLVALVWKVVGPLENVGGLGGWRKWIAGAGP